ncbi:hypothetical protein [Streptomyces sp. NPDC008092]
MTESPPQASGPVATGRSEGDLYPLPPGVPLPRAAQQDAGPPRSATPSE